MSVKCLPTNEKLKYGETVYSRTRGLYWSHLKFSGIVRAEPRLHSSVPAIALKLFFEVSVHLTVVLKYK